MDHLGWPQSGVWLSNSKLRQCLSKADSASSPWMRATRQPLHMRAPPQNRAIEYFYIYYADSPQSLCPPRITPPGLLEFPPYTVLVRVQPRQVQTEPPDNPHVLCPIAQPYPTVIFLERHIQHLMRFILHFPMLTYAARHPCRTHRQGTDIALCLGLHLPMPKLLPGHTSPKRPHD